MTELAELTELPNSRKVVTSRNHYGQDWRNCYKFQRHNTKKKLCVCTDRNQLFYQKDLNVCIPSSREEMVYSWGKMVHQIIQESYWARGWWWVEWALNLEYLSVTVFEVHKILKGLHICKAAAEGDLGMDLSKMHVFLYSVN